MGLKKILFNSLLFVAFVSVSTAAAADQLDWPTLLARGSQCSGLAQELILSVIWVESKGNPYAVNVNGVGGFSPSSREKALKIIYKYNRANTDLGLMQVNWKTWGRVYGLKAVDFLDPLTNVCVGSKILRDYIDAHKGSWRGVGAYNAVSDNKQRTYATAVGATYKKILELFRRQNAMKVAEAAPQMTYETESHANSQADHQNTSQNDSQITYEAPGAR